MSVYLSRACRLEGRPVGSRYHGSIGSWFGGRSVVEAVLKGAFGRISFTIVSILLMRRASSDRMVLMTGVDYADTVGKSTG